MSQFLATLSAQRMNLWVDFLQHLQISLLSLIIAILVAVPLALLLRRFPKLAEAVLQVTGIFQTIPSLALLGLLIPLIGIGTPPAVVALVVYALFPILQNTYTGLQQIDPTLDEAAIAFGMNRRERLVKYQLAMALPFIMAGVRSAAVMIIGTATLAALIGAGGLGNLILLGINSYDSNLILIGALSSALLAVLVNFAIHCLEKARLRTILISFVSTLAVLLATFIPWTGGSGPSLTIGGKLGSEPSIIINMYQQLVEKDSDIQVSLKPNFGDTTFLYGALKAGKIDLYPEYSGTILETFLKEPVTSTQPAAVWQQAQTGIKRLAGLDYLRPSAFEDTYALAVKTSFAKAHRLRTISDLAAFARADPGAVTAGFDLEFANRSDGYKGLQKTYGLNLPAGSVKTMQTSLIYSALNSGAINLAEVYSTDSQIKQFGLTLLTDDQGLFPPYQPAPLLQPGLLKKYPQLQGILDKLAGRITDEQMQEMNYEVNVGHQTAAAVAHRFLVKEGLL